MIDINFLINYSNRLKTIIDGINYAQVIIDDSQVVNFLEERSLDDNLLLFALIPDFTPKGNNTDNIQKQANTVFLVLQKTEYDDITHEEFLQNMQNTLVAAKAIETQMIEDKLDYTETGCQFMKQLNTGSIKIEPLWGLAGCNGWIVEFNFAGD